MGTEKRIGGIDLCLPFHCLVIMVTRSVFFIFLRTYYDLISIAPRAITVALTLVIVLLRHPHITSKKHLMKGAGSGWRGLGLPRSGFQL
jgi:hypothetical protein